MHRGIVSGAGHLSGLNFSLSDYIFPVEKFLFLNSKIQKNGLEIVHVGEFFFFWGGGMEILSIIISCVENLRLSVGRLRYLPAPTNVSTHNAAADVPLKSPLIIRRNRCRCKRFRLLRHISP